MQKLIQVYIEHKQLKLNQSYTYLAPLNCEVGMRVEVNFNNQSCVGFVVETEEYDEQKIFKYKQNEIEIKEVLRVIDNEPLLNQELIELGFLIDEFSIKGMTKETIEERLKDTQVMYFAGGNTFYLLDQVIKTACAEIIKNKIADGVIYIGSSAGSMILGKKIDLVSTIDDRTKAPNLESDGLGIVDFALLPHWGSAAFREGYSRGFANMYCEGNIILPLTNQQYIWVNDSKTEIIQVPTRENF